MKGSCLCGAVTFSTDAVPAAPWACHCGQCRKQSGHYWASLTVDRADLSISGDVRWYQSSPKVERGFCPTCGSFLFWRPNTNPSISFAAGAVDGPVGLPMDRHIFTAQKGDYYLIPDVEPQE